MIDDINPKQLARLSPEAARAVRDYRRRQYRESKRTPSINGSLNDLIIFGWGFVQANDEQRRAQAQKDETK